MPPKTLTEKQKMRNAYYDRVVKGKPHLIPLDDSVRPHVMTLRHAGIPIPWIAAEAAVSEAMIIYIENGTTTMVYRDIADRLLRVNAADWDGSGFTKASGIYMPITGTQRRLSALQYDGFTFSFLADKWGKKLQFVSALANGKYDRIVSGTYVEVLALYEELAGRKPSEYGITEWQRKHAVTFASRRKGSAPSIYWHDEALDDPNGFPDWTGVCGETRGRIVHERMGIPMCAPCNAAQATYEKDRKARHREAAARGEEVVRRRGNGKRNPFDDEALMSRLRHDFEAWTSVPVMEERYSNDITYLRTQALKDGMWTHPHARPDRNWAPKKSRGMVES